MGDSPAANHVTINSSTDAFYDYAIEWDGTDLHVIACNIADLLTEPGVNSGGSFARVYTYSGYSDRTGSLPLVFATKTGGQMGLSTAGINKIQIPFGVNHILVSEGSSGNGKFSSDSQAFLDGTQHDAAGSTFNPPTVNAGTTYTFVYDNSLEANDYIEFLLQGTTTPYTTGVTAFDNTVGGNPAAGDGYKGITFAVPADAPPLDVRFYNDFASSFDTQRELPISGSSYVVDVTGITTIGPAGNISGTDLTGDAWFKLDNDIDSGMRVTIDGPTLLEIYNQMDNGENVYVGIKDSANWTEGGSYEGIKSIYLKIHKPSYGGYFLGIYSSSNGSSYSYGWTNVESTVTNDFSAFIELTNSGNNIRAGITHSSLHTDDIATTPYSEWAGPKTQTGDQGFGISAEEFVFLFDHFSSTTDFDTSQVTWTDINEISNPTPPATMQTDWDHGIVFAGSNERMEQEGGGSYSRNPMYLSSGVTVPEHTTDGTLTSNHSSARPWAFSVVFKHAGNASNQHIFNHGEGSNGDNIYLRTSADRHLYFGWGIDGGANECKLMDDPLNTNRWYGVYVAHRGTRLQSGDATAANLAEAFDIYIVTSNTGFTSFDQGNRSTVTRWTNGSVGNRMNRSITGNTYLGGRDNNRSWHGKIAATVVTTLRVGDAMPGEAEILEMIRDPKAWLTNYKVGNWYRVTGQSFNNSDFQLNDIGAARATQVWLMGDGTSDAYAVIRNQVYPGDQNESAIRMLSMVSGDIENVAINGLT